MRIDLDRAVLHRRVRALLTGPCCPGKLAWEGRTARKREQINCHHGRRALGEGPATALK